MTNITLYCYKRENGGTTVSPQMPSTEYTTLTRLVADDGHILTNGEVETKCIDVHDDEIGNWSEIEYEEEFEEADEE